MIYNFFGSKDNLRRIIIKNMLDESIEKIRTLIEKEGSFSDKIEEYIRIRTWYYGKYSLRLFFEAVESDPEVRQYVDEFNAANKRLLMRSIAEGKRSGIFSPDVSDSAIEIYIDMIQTYLMHNREIRERIERNPELIREINMMFIDGLIGEQKPESLTPQREP